MAEEEKKAPPEEKQAETPESKPEPAQEEWTTIVEGKYKDPAEMAKAYKDLESKLGTQGSELAQAREFASVVEPLLDVVRNDPELFNTIDQKLRSKGTSVSDAPRDSKSQEEIRTAAGDLIISSFEKKYGLDQMNDGDRAEARRKIGEKISQLTGQGINQVDLRRLGPVLEDAYFLANKDKITDKAKLEALLAAEGNNEAVIPSVPQSGGSTEANLTPEEARVAAKMGLTREQYLEGKKQSGR